MEKQFYCHHRICTNLWWKKKTLAEPPSIASILRGMQRSGISKIGECKDPVLVRSTRFIRQIAKGIKEYMVLPATILS
jgi:hypothetical protein